MNALPKEIRIQDQLIELNYNVVKDDKTVKVFFDYSFKKSGYPSEDYMKMAFYFNQIVKKGNEKIVFSRKEGKNLSLNK